MQFNRSIACVAGVMLGGVSAVASAATLAPGGFELLGSGTTAAAEPWLKGTVVQDVVTPFSYDGWFSDMGSGETVVTHGNVTGSVQSRVVRAIDGTYDFYWRVNVNSGSFLPVADFGLKNFAPGTYNADYRTDGVGSVSPATVNQSTTGDVNWAFGQYVPPSAEVYPGEQSYFFFLDTKSHFYNHNATFSLGSERDSGGSMMIDWGGQSGQFNTFGPTSLIFHPLELQPVPEPESVWLTLAGMFAIGTVVKRGRRRAQA